MKLRIKVKNTGSMAGVAELVIKSVTDSGTPVVEDTVSTPELGIQEVSDWVEVTSHRLPPRPRACTMSSV